MSTRMLKMTEQDKAWCAGIVSVMGQMRLSRTALPHVELLIQSGKHKEAMRRLGQILGVKVRDKQVGFAVYLTDDEFTMFWGLIFPYVTEERVLEYESLYAEMRRAKAEYEDKLAYQAERAAEPHSHSDVIRRRDEALYHNQDPAVQVVDGFVHEEMAQQYDLDQAQRARERAEAQMRGKFS